MAVCVYSMHHFYRSTNTSTQQITSQADKCQRYVYAALVVMCLPLCFTVHGSIILWWIYGRSRTFIGVRVSHFPPRRPRHPLPCSRVPIWDRHPATAVRFPGHASDSENDDSPLLVQEHGTVLPARLHEIRSTVTFKRHFVTWELYSRIFLVLNSCIIEFRICMLKWRHRQVLCVSWKTSKNCGPFQKHLTKSNSRKSFLTKFSVLYRRIITRCAKKSAQLRNPSSSVTLFINWLLNWIKGKKRKFTTSCKVDYTSIAQLKLQK